MKVRRQLDELAPLIVDRVQDLGTDDWFKAPEGKWSIAQIVGHVALGVDVVGAALVRRRDKAPMTRRASPKQSLFRHIVLLRGRIPQGRVSPAAAEPIGQPDPELVMAELHMGIVKLGTILDEWPDDQMTTVYVRHPVLGDLNVPEWVRFHLVHGRHHARQIDERRTWLELQH